MNSLRFKIISTSIFFLNWVFLVIFFLSPWYEERFKKDILELEQYKFSNFLLNYNVIQYNKIDYIEGEESYFQDAFGFPTPILERVIKATKALSSLAFINISLLIIFTIIFIIHTKFMIENFDEDHFEKEKKIWKWLLGLIPFFTFILMLTSLILITFIPTAVRQDCIDQNNLQYCQDQNRFHKSFSGGNSTWKWYPSKGWYLLLVDCILSFLGSMYCSYSIFIKNEIVIKR